MPAAIILAAGSSRRLGRPKQTVLLSGESLLDRTIRIATEADLSPVFVVLDPRLNLQPNGCTVVPNPDAQQGIAFSIRRGIAAASKATGVVLMTCDQPAVTAAHLRTLCEQPEVPTGSGYAGKIGIPAYFPAASFDALLQLQGDTGARDLLRSARVIQTEALAFDIDTEEDLDRALNLYQQEMQ
jgi:molybdenum cofactor cytidylyltransferase